MSKQNVIMRLQKQYHTNGYALVSPQSGRVFAFEKTLKSLYKTIKVKKLSDENKSVMHIPDPTVKHVYILPVL